MVPTIIKKPLLCIQCDWNETLSENGGKAWVMCKELGNRSFCGEIKSNGVLSNDFNISVSNGFKVQSISQKCITVLHESPNCRSQFFAPDMCYKNIHEKSVVGMDVTNCGLGVSVCSQNKLCVWDCSNGDVRRVLVGHVWDVYTCRFFPSGVVVLSGGADMLLKIWSAETAQCAVTLTGHTGAIMDTAIVERGKNIISVSKDGTARLWDCGQSSCITLVTKENGTINSCALQSVDINLGSPIEPPSEREIATENKLLIYGCENGFLRGVGIQSRNSIFEYKCSAAINACCFLSNFQALCGTQDGLIYLFDIRNMSVPSIIWEESASPVLSLLPKRSGFFSGRADGTCIFTTLNSDESFQLTGSDFDPIYRISTDGINIFTASRDGHIRKYKFPALS